MLLVSNRNPFLHGEVESSNDSDAFGNGSVHFGHFEISRRFDEDLMESFVHFCHYQAVFDPSNGVDNPCALQGRYVRMGRCGFTKSVDRSCFQDQPDIVEVFKELEVKPIDEPAIPKPAFQVPLVLEAEEGFSYGGTTGFHVVGDGTFRELVPGENAKLKNVVLELGINLVDQGFLLWVLSTTTGTRLSSELDDFTHFEDRITRTWLLGKVNWKFLPTSPSHLVYINVDWTSPIIHICNSIQKVNISNYD